MTVPAGHSSSSAPPCRGRGPREDLPQSHSDDLEELPIPVADYTALAAELKPGREERSLETAGKENASTRVVREMPRLHPSCGLT